MSSHRADKNIHTADFPCQDPQEREAEVPVSPLEDPVWGVSEASPRSPQKEPLVWSGTSSPASCVTVRTLVLVARKAVRQGPSLGQLGFIPRSTAQLAWLKIAFQMQGHILSCSVFPHARTHTNKHPCISMGPGSGEGEEGLGPADRLLRGPGFILQFLSWGQDFAS